MEFRILGPVEVRQGGRPVRVSGAKERAVLAFLLLHANQLVSSDRIIDEIWGPEAEETARKSLQVRVSELRKALRAGATAADALLQGRGAGYVLSLSPDQLDLHQFERLVEKGRGALADDRAEAAAEALREALALWRGPALSDFAYEPFAQVAITRLEELRLAALELRIDADLALGRHAELVGELRALGAEHPLRERLPAQLMVALYRLVPMPSCLHPVPARGVRVARDPQHDPDQLAAVRAYLSADSRSEPFGLPPGLPLWPGGKGRPRFVIALF